MPRSPAQTPWGFQSLNGGGGGMELEGSLSAHTLRDSLLGVVVLVGREEASWYAWGQWSKAEGSPGLALLEAPFRWECPIGKAFFLM